MSEGHETAGRKDSVSWTKAQEDQVSALYGSLKGEYQQDANKKLFSGTQLPYGQAHSILVENLKKQEQASGLEGKIDHTPSKSSKALPKSKLDYLTGILGGTALVASMAAVAPPIVGALGIAAAAYALIPKYYTKKPAEAH